MLSGMEARNLAVQVFRAALKAADPYEAVKHQKEFLRSRIERDGVRDVIAIGFGKAACPMARAIEDILGNRVRSGVVITKYGHCAAGYPTALFTVHEAAHPLPDENGVHATREVLNLLTHAGRDTLVICLVSGGGSALLVAPCEGVTLKEKQGITDLLLRAGATIDELNTVRKHLSKVKGGRLAEAAYPAKVISLILSDVIDDTLDVIASGPTVADSTTFGEALAVIHKYDLKGKAPAPVLLVLEQGASHRIAETPKADSKALREVENVIVGSNRKAIEEAKAEAERAGCHAEIVSARLLGEARDAAAFLATRAKERAGRRDRIHPLCLISGGETTVTVRGNGTGGRNTELALAFALDIAGLEGVTLLSAGTDGTDGPTDAAGAIVDGQTVTRSGHLGLDPAAYLARNDSYTFFKKAGGLLITGPTGTNVMDLQIAVIS